MDKYLEARLRESFAYDGRGLTFEDYCIFVLRVGHWNYSKYNQAHRRDVDITTGMDVWEALRKTEAPWVKAVSL